MGCVIAPGRLPIEFRLAIGASCKPTEFDGTAILNLCSRDPGISPPYGNLVSRFVRPAVLLFDAGPQNYLIDLAGC